MTALFKLQNRHSTAIYGRKVHLQHSAERIVSSLRSELYYCIILSGILSKVAGETQATGLITSGLCLTDLTPGSTLLHIQKTMKYLLLLFVAALLLFTACAPRPQYKTAKGKKKLKYYNSIQYQQPRP